MKKGGFEVASKTYRQNKRTGKWSIEIRQGQNRLFYKSGFEDKEEAEIVASEVFTKLDLKDDFQPLKVGVKGADITDESLISDLTSLWISEYIKNKKQTTIYNYKQIEKLTNEYFQFPVKNLTEIEFEKNIQNIKESGVKSDMIVQLRGVINRVLKYFNYKIKKN